MTEAEALQHIKGYASAGRIRYSPHALERMAERGAREDDVRRAIATATRAVGQANGRWLVTGGVDRDGDELTPVVVLEGGVVVVTLY